MTARALTQILIRVAKFFIKCCEEEKKNVTIKRVKQR